ncbi:hypothetical protein IID62_00825 [candidate division KSB1 bacterium]|nr:hypothetical protein [candidate division KSB1 bacterium]
MLKFYHIQKYILIKHLSLICFIITIKLCKCNFIIKQDTTFTTKADGTGLGLFECKIIIEKHRGKFYFESEVGVGSIFYVVLPRE